MSADTFPDFVLDQLRELDRVALKRMFSGHGLYAEGVFFGIVNRGALFFKVDEATRAAYVDAGSGPFKPTKKMTLRTYYEVPADVLENRDQLTIWARQAIVAARVAARAKRKPVKRRTVRHK